jgi:hypothetical protein
MGSQLVATVVMSAPPVVIQGILGTRNLVHYLLRRSLNGIAVKRLNQQPASPLGAGIANLILLNDSFSPT